MHPPASPPTVQPPTSPPTVQPPTSPPTVQPPTSPPAPDGPLTIDCADCAHRHTSVCDDCVVSFIVGRQPDDAVVVDADEARAVRLLGRAGLVPAVRHSNRAG